MRGINGCWDDATHNQIVNYSSRLLWRFVQQNAKEAEAEEVLLNLSGLTKRDLIMLADIRLLLSDEVQQLLNYIAPKIISRLSKESVNENISSRGNIRGRINWHKTIGERATAGNDTSLYVYSQRAQIFDLPENRLLLYIIRQINEKARKFVSEDYINLTWYAEAEDDSKWVEKVSIISSRSARLLRNPYITKIGNLYELSDRIIEQTKRCRSSHYKELAAIAERFVMCQRNPLSYLNDELNGNIFEPLNYDTLYEIAVLFKTIYSCLENGWEETRTGLIGSSSESVSTLVKNDRELVIYYQKLPKLMAQISSYGPLMAEYGLSEKLRRPDIILQIRNGQYTEFIIVEVKRSQRREYLVDGSYKLLGYLKDFEQIKDDATSLRGFLVGWSGIEQQDYKSDKEIHLFDWSDYAGGLKELVNS